MSTVEQNKTTPMRSEKMSESGQVNEITAALTDMYNRTAIELPQDPWVDPCLEEDCAGRAMDESYN